MEIKKLKIKLYSLLLNKDAEDLSTTEVDIIYALGRDPDIQSAIETEKTKEPVSFRTKTDEATESSKLKINW